MMSNLAVMVFDNMEEAGEVRKALADSQKQGLISIDDAAVVIKDKDGRVHIRQQTNGRTKIGFGSSSFLGLFIGFMFGGPLVSALPWTLSRSPTEADIHGGFVNDVKGTMNPNTSALFIITRDSDPAGALATLCPHKCRVLPTIVPTEADESLRHALEIYCQLFSVGMPKLAL